MKTSSRSAATTSSSTVQTSRNLNIEGTDGITVGEAGGDVTILQTDHNAVGDATALASKSVSVAENIASDSLRASMENVTTVATLAVRSGEQIGDVANSAFSTVERALSEVKDLSTSSFGQLESLARDAVGSIMNFVRDLQGTAQDQLGKTVTALNAIAVEQNKSSDQRLAEVSSGAVRNVVIVVGIIAAGATLYAIFKRG